MLKYLIALADELDRCGEIKAASMVDSLIKRASLASYNEMGLVDPQGKFHSTEGLTHPDWTHQNRHLVGFEPLIVAIDENEPGSDIPFGMPPDYFDAEGNTALDAFKNAGWIRVKPDAGVELSGIYPDNIELVKKIIRSIAKDNPGRTLYVDDGDGSKHIHVDMRGRPDFSVLKIAKALKKIKLAGIELVKAEDLPPLKSEHVRLVHFTVPQHVDGIKQNGLRYSWDATTTVRPFSNELDAAKATNSTDVRFKNGVAVILDMPFDEWRKHTRFKTAPGVIEPEYIVGFVPEGQYIEKTAGIEVDDWENGTGNWWFTYKNYRIGITESLGDPPHYLPQITPIIGWKKNESNPAKMEPVLPGVLEADRFYLPGEDDLETAKSKALQFVDKLPSLPRAPEVWGEHRKPSAFDRVFLEGWDEADKKSSSSGLKIKKAEEPPPHNTPEEMMAYHEWLKRPDNWINPELVEYVFKGGKPIKDLVYGMSWRNCPLCHGTITKTPKPGDALLIEER